MNQAQAIRLQLYIYMKQAQAIRLHLYIYMIQALPEV
jgi:hypothetical protein